MEQFKKGQKVRVWDNYKSDAIIAEYFGYNEKSPRGFIHIVIKSDGASIAYKNCEAMPEKWVPDVREDYWAISSERIYSTICNNTAWDKSVINNGLYWKTDKEADEFFIKIKELKSAMDEGREFFYKPNNQ